jgi:hypothetical protein
VSRPLGTRRLPHYITKPGCRKASYASREDAETRLRQIAAKATGRKRQRHRQVLPQRAYLCPTCELWHLTSKPPREATG